MNFPPIDVYRAMLAGNPTLSMRKQGRSTWTPLQAALHQGLHEHAELLMSMGAGSIDPTCDWFAFLARYSRNSMLCCDVLERYKCPIYPDTLQIADIHGSVVVGIAIMRQSVGMRLPHYKTPALAEYAAHFERCAANTRAVYHVMRVMCDIPVPYCQMGAALIWINK